MFDTGNLSGLLVSTELADSLTLAPSGQVQSQNSDGSPAGSKRRFTVNQLRVFGEEWVQQTAVERHEKYPPALIGPRFLQDRRFTLDYRSRALAVSKSAAPPTAQAGVAEPLVWSSRLPGLLVVQGSVNQHRVLLQLDTGKSRTCIDGGFLASLGLRNADARGVPIPDLRLGGRSFSVPSAKVVGFGGISEGLPEPIIVGVGSDVLRNIVLTVDYRTRTAWFAAPQQSAPGRGM